MGKFYDNIPENLLDWLQTQEVFWVATAPLATNGHVNCSPKGLRGTFHVEGQDRGKGTFIRSRLQRAYLTQTAVRSVVRGLNGIWYV